MGAFAGRLVGVLARAIRRRLATLPRMIDAPTPYTVSQRRQYGARSLGV